MLLSAHALSPIHGDFDESRSNGSEAGWTPRARLNSINNVLGMPLPLTSPGSSEIANGKDAKEEQANLNTIWKQIMDPVLDYCQVRRLLNFLWDVQLRMCEFRRT